MISKNMNDEFGVGKMLDRGDRVLSEYQNLNLPYISNNGGGTGIQVDVDSIKQKKSVKKSLNYNNFYNFGNKTANFGHKTANPNSNLISPRFSTLDPS